MADRIRAKTGPGGTDNHKHVVVLSMAGDGVTSIGGKSPHVHMVTKFRVLKTGTGHSHKLYLRG
jgi:hypothetical protein